MTAVQAGEPPVHKGAVSEALLSALAQPKEREKLVRLEQELTRLVSNPSVDRLDMQPMSAHNRALVGGVAAYFGLRFVVVPADETTPAAAPHEERLLPVWLCKCEETRMPVERLASIVPIPEEAAPILRQDKVQLMRRAGGGANGKSTKAPEQLSAAEEQARHKDKEDAYAAARQRIFGGAAQGGDGVAVGDTPAPPPADDSAPPVPAERAAGGAPPGTAAAPSVQPNPTRSVNKSEAQRAHDMMDPDFSRHSVRWTPAAAPQVPMQCAGGGYDEAAAQHHRHYLGAGAAQSAPRYSQCSGWGLQMPQQMPQQLNAPSLGVGMSLSLGGGAVPMAMAGQMPLYARPAGQMPLGAGAVQGRSAYGAYGAYGAPAVGMPSPPLAQPRLPGADCGSFAAAAATSAPLHAAPAPAGAFAQQQAYAAPAAAGVYAQQQQAYAAMLAALPASRPEAGNGFYQQTASSVGANSFDPGGGHSASTHPYLPAAAQPGAWTQKGA